MVIRWRLSPWWTLTLHCLNKGKSKGKSAAIDFLLLPLAVLPPELHHHHRDVVSLRRVQRKRSHVIQNRVVHLYASCRRLEPDDLPKPVHAVKIVIRPARFAHAI